MAEMQSQSLTEGTLTSIFINLTRSTDSGCHFQRKLGGNPARAVRSTALLLSALALTGCGDSANDVVNDPPLPTTSADDECSGEFDPFEPGMTKLAKPDDITVELADADPSPPVVRKDNIWWLKLSDADGNALLGAQVVASPYMPKHQHGSAEVVVEEQGKGQYRLSPIELIMPGVWEIPLSITTAGGAASETLFRFCIAER